MRERGGKLNEVTAQPVAQAAAGKPLIVAHLPCDYNSTQ
jgi:hypothetical protein